nr:HPr(Ser) kinase/phosphatase [Lachnospiraceae bacterium]
MAKGVKLEKVLKAMGLRNYIEEMDLKEYVVELSDVNRPGLQLTGFYDHFEVGRLQVVGMVEHSFLSTKTEEEKKQIWDTFFSYKVPGVIFCRGFEPEDFVIELARKYDVPLMGTDRGTSEFMAELIATLGLELAPSTTIHGVLVDVYGEGLLIMGESGIGKSEAALELIRRGHRLVADDVVE